MAPLSINPAKAGNFYGTARIGGLARTQGNSIANKGYGSYAIYADAPIIKGFRDKDWVGVGFTIANDVAGELEQTFNYSLFGASYHFALDKRGSTYITVGFQSGTYGKKIANRDAASFADGNGIQSQEYTSIQDNFNRGTEYAGGVEFRTELNDRTKFRVGARYGHIGKIRQSVAGGSYRLPARIGGHFEADYLLNSRVIISPSLLYEHFKPASQFVAQCKGRYLFDPEKKIEFSAGLGYRFGDAAQVLFGLGWDQIQVGIGYDLPVSAQSAEAIPLGGLEIAASYIIRIYKEPQVDPVIFCPRF
jgi:type IX secretion system PorP/SprF family membrane protein